MDPLSQAMIGSAVAGSAARRDTLRKAVLCGALGGLAPDADIMIRSAADPLMAIEYHRHFTHSLFFIPFGGLIVAALIWLLIYRRQGSFWAIYLFTTLGFATHGLLDACTSYGTRLLWPFSDLRVGWNIVSIIDPLYTLPLVGFVIAACVKKSSRIIQIGLAISLLYLGYGYVKHKQVEGIVLGLATERGHQVERLLLNPTIGNNRLWRTVYQSAGRYYVDAVYVPPFENHAIHEGSSVVMIDKHVVFPSLPQDSVQRQDIRRFAYFSQDFIYMHPDNPFIIADFRYGRLPYDTQSMWGIEVNPRTPDKHASFARLRNFNDEHYATFWSMLKGEFEYSSDDGSVILDK